MLWPNVAGPQCVCVCKVNTWSCWKNMLSWRVLPHKWVRFLRRMKSEWPRDRWKILPPLPAPPNIFKWKFRCVNIHLVLAWVWHTCKSEVEKMLKTLQGRDLVLEFFNSNLVFLSHTVFCSCSSRTTQCPCRGAIRNTGQHRFLLFCSPSSWGPGTAATLPQHTTTDRAGGR